MRVFVARDIDGFFGLFIDNLVQLLTIVALCGVLCGMSGENSRFIYALILPGTAVSLLIGNLFYAWQARQLARREGRDDVTALPYGINTPSLLVFIFFVMAPVYQETKSVQAAWEIGLLACLGSGIIEFVGSFIAERIRKNTPRAALLSTLAGIAIGFISMMFALKIWARPLLSMIPMAIVLVTYFSGVRFPLRLPGGLVAILAGTALGWILPAEYTQTTLSVKGVQAAWEHSGWYLPVWCGDYIWGVLRDPSKWVPFLTLIIPMGIINVIGSLQNIESAEAAGDRFGTCSSLAVNGLGTIAAALFGSCFPTTIYIGHPGWKELGARASYSTMNGIAVSLLCLTGTLALVDAIIPFESGISIILWIGLIITAQAFSSTPKHQAPAVAVGLFPAVAAWGATVVFGAFNVAGGKTMQAVLEAEASGANVNGFLISGLILLERGYIFTCMIIAAIFAHLIERQFRVAAIWSFLGATLTLAGFCHAFYLHGNAVDSLMIWSAAPEGAYYNRAFELAIGYASMGLFFLLVGAMKSWQTESEGGHGVALHEGHRHAPSESTTKTNVANDIAKDGEST